MNQVKQERDYSLDLIRILAGFFVISGHFFLCINFLTNTVYGKRYVIACTMWHFFRCSVPLFLMLTGYLMCKKVYSRSYFRGITGTLLIYLLASLASVPVHMYLGETYSFKRVILGTLQFTLAPYSWYIEMYIGLFFMIPFLNKIYNGSSKREKNFLIILLLLITALPQVLNIFDMSAPGWWRHPLQHLGYQKVLPEYWTELFPFTYYFIGCYLAEFRPRLSARKTGLVFGLLILHIVLGGLFNYYINAVNEALFYRGIWQAWGSIMNVITAVLVFVLCLQVKTSAWGEKTKKFVRYLSGLTLGTYLMSWAFDYTFYNPTFGKFTDGKMHLEFFLPMVLAIYVCSALASAVLNLIKDGILKLISKLHRSKALAS